MEFPTLPPIDASPLFGGARDIAPLAKVGSLTLASPCMCPRAHAREKGKRKAILLGRDDRSSLQRLGHADPFGERGDVAQEGTILSRSSGAPSANEYRCGAVRFSTKRRCGRIALKGTAAVVFMLDYLMPDVRHVLTTTERTRRGAIAKDGEGGISLRAYWISPMGRTYPCQSCQNQMVPPEIRSTRPGHRGGMFRHEGSKLHAPGT